MTKSRKVIPVRTRNEHAEFFPSKPILRYAVEIGGSMMYWVRILLAIRCSMSEILKVNGTYVHRYFC